MGHINQILKSYLSLKDKLIDNIITYVLHAVLIERLLK